MNGALVPELPRARTTCFGCLPEWKMSSYGVHPWDFEVLTAFVTTGNSWSLAYYLGCSGQGPCSSSAQILNTYGFFNKRRPLLKSREPFLNAKSTSLRIRKMGPCLVLPLTAHAILGKSLSYSSLNFFHYLVCYLPLKLCVKVVHLLMKTCCKL